MCQRLFLLNTKMCHRGFTFIELLVYSSLLSLLFVAVISVWFSIARSNALFTRLAKEQEESVFATSIITNQVSGQPDYSSAETLIRADIWHTISAPTFSIDSTSSSSSLGALMSSTTISHLRVYFSPTISSSSQYLDYYHVLPK